jgi:alkaline phosphatase D
VIPALNVFHPDLVRSAVEPNVFLLLEADSTVNPPRLEGTLINAKGERVFSYAVSLPELTPR